VQLSEIVQEFFMFQWRVWAFAAVYGLWGGSYLAIRFVVHVIPPFLAAGVRYSLSALLLLGISFLGRRDPLPGRRELLNCLATGVMMFVFGYSAIYWAETHIASWLAAMLTSTSFLWTCVAECVLLRTDRLRMATLLPLAGGVAGMALLVGYPFKSMGQTSIAASFAVLGSAITWSLTTVSLKRLKLPGSFVQTAGLQLFAAAMALLPISFALGEWQRLPEASVVLHPGPVFGMLYLVVGGSGLAMSAFHWLLARESPSLVASSSYVNPIVAMLGGIVLVHERYTGTQLCGAAAVLLSVVLVWRAKSKSTEEM